MRQTLSSPGSNWAVKISIASDSVDELLSISSCGKKFLSVYIDDGKLHVHATAQIVPNLVFPEKEELDFSLESALIPKVAVIEWLDYSFRLYGDSELKDEEWPLGALPASEWDVEWDEKLCRLTFCDPDQQAAGREMKLSGPMQYFTWPGNNTGVGDCMPFEREGRYCLYYLFDRRGHRSKGGLGAHQWAQISSADLKTWTLHPMAIPITEQWEGSICTGSLIEKEGIIYAFYAVRMSDGSAARMTWATSKDGVHFMKSGKYFALTQPYEPVSARDPKVFLGEDGKYHMLVTTSLSALDSYGGCLAHLISTDLMEWKQLDPFIVPGYYDQPECSDYFAWNGWYYLIFSSFATARYRLSRHPSGPWMKPEYDILDSVENQVVKTAAYGNRRLMTGFLARIPRTYAGNALTHELIQNPDGTLGVRFLPEILPDFQTKISVPDFIIENAQGRSDVKIAESIAGCRLQAKAFLSGDAALGGLSIVSDKHEHSLDFDRSSRRISAMRPDQRFHMGDPRLQILGIDLTSPIVIDLIIFKDILDLTLSNGRAMTMRLSEDMLSGFTLSVYVQNGRFEGTDISLAIIR